MSNFFDNLLEIFAWCRIVASPLFLGLGIASFVYFPNPNTTSLLIACGISFSGIAIGILWANSIYQKNGTYRFMSRIHGSADLDDFQEKMKREELKNIMSEFKSKGKVSSYNSSKYFEEVYNDLGVFQYTRDGFSFTHNNIYRQLNWDEITQINAFKRDQITIDRIEMEIISIKTNFTISEDLPGWYQFILKTKEIYPTIPKDWDIKIIQRAFDTNFTTIYMKNDKYNHHH